MSEVKNGVVVAAQHHIFDLIHVNLPINLRKVNQALNAYPAHALVTLSTVHGIWTRQRTTAARTPGDTIAALVKNSLGDQSKDRLSVFLDVLLATRAQRDANA